MDPGACPSFRQELARQLQQLRLRCLGTQGSDHRVEMLKRFDQLLTSVEDPCARNCYEPGHLTASTFLFNATCSQIALIYHPKLKKWLQPGGHIDQHDPTAQHAAKRELLEELGAVPTTCFSQLVDVDIHEIPENKNEPAHLHFDLRFAASAPNAVALSPSSEVQQARWVDIVDLLKITNDSSVLSTVEWLVPRPEFRELFSCFDTGMKRGLAT